MTTVAIVLGMTILPALGLRWLLIRPQRRAQGMGDESGMSFTAPDDRAAADVLCAIAASDLPEGHCYSIDWMDPQKRTPGR